MCGECNIMSLNIVVDVTEETLCELSISDLNRI
jgi:hypothetical protein